MSEARSFTIPGMPQGKGRPRTQIVGGKYAHIYTPAKTAAYENLVALEYEKLYGGEKPLEGPVRLDIIGFWPLVKSDYWPVNTKHHGELKESGTKKLNAEILPLSKPDADNLAKAVSDGLNHSGAWGDDCQIASMFVGKKYSETPFVGVMVSQIGGEKDSPLPAKPEWMTNREWLCTLNDWQMANWIFSESLCMGREEMAEWLNQTKKWSEKWSV